MTDGGLGPTGGLVPTDRGGNPRRTYNPKFPDMFFKDDPASNAELMKRALQAQSRQIALTGGEGVYPEKDSPDWGDGEKTLEHENIENRELRSKFTEDELKDIQKSSDRGQAGGVAYPSEPRDMEDLSVGEINSRVEERRANPSIFEEYYAEDPGINIDTSFVRRNTRENPMTQVAQGIAYRKLNEARNLEDEPDTVTPSGAIEAREYVEGDDAESRGVQMRKDIVADQSNMGVTEDDVRAGLAARESMLKDKDA